MSRTICNKCGSIYELKSTKLIFRDKDSIDCEICGEELHSWNAAKMWEAKLLDKHENHITKDE